MHILLRYLGTVFAVILTIRLVPGLSVDSGVTILLIAVVWSAMSLVIKPVLTLLTLPITLITFGVFALILNALLFWLVAALVPGFVISGFWAAFFGALVLSIFNWLIQQVVG